MGVARTEIRTSWPRILISRFHFKNLADLNLVVTNLFHISSIGKDCSEYTSVKENIMVSSVEQIGQYQINVLPYEQTELNVLWMTLMSSRLAYINQNMRRILSDFQ